MKPRSIIWLPLPSFISGSEESASEQAARDIEELLSKAKGVVGTVLSSIFATGWVERVNPETAGTTPQCVDDGDSLILRALRSFVVPFETK